MGFVISRHMLEVKQHLTTVLEELEGKPQRGSMEAFIFHRIFYFYFP